jgi:hypothetical protein
MPAPTKFATIYGLALKLESSYNNGGAPSLSTDGVQLEELFDYQPQYANDGARAAPPGMLGYQRRVAPSGRYGEPKFKVAPKGFAAAYSASNTPNVHVPLKICGLDGAVTVTGGLEKWVYTPTVGLTGYASGSGYLYGHGELYAVQGLLGDFTLNVAVGEIPTLDFALKGVQPADVTDVSLPAITYPTLGTDPPKATGLTLSILGIATFSVRKATLKWGRAVGPRLDANVSGGHAGFAPGRRTPSLDITIENPALSVLDLYGAFRDAYNNAIWQFTVGTVQYNRHKWSGPAAQLMAPPKLSVESSSGISLADLSLQLNPTTIIASDDLTVTFD